MKTKITFKDKEFEVEREINEKIHLQLKSDTEEQKEDDVIKFYLSKRDKFLPDKLINFLKLTGINWTKENETLYYYIDDQMVVEGWFDIVGRVVSDEVISFYYWEELFTTNIFFSNGLNVGIRKEFGGYQTFRCDFYIVFHQKNNLI